MADQKNVDSNEYILTGQAVFAKEIDGLKHIEDNLGEQFRQIIELISACKGKCICCGMGKSGHIARKVSATLSSLGTPSFFLHPAEALHGDLGMVSENDVVIIFSNSGDTSEIAAIIPSMKLIGAKLVGITGKKDSVLGKECDICQILTIAEEADGLNLAPTVSTTAMLVYGDAIAVTLAHKNGFTRTDFAKYHPAGTLGKKVLLRVADIMATGSDMPIVQQGCGITEAIMEMSRKGLGVVIIEDSAGFLTGILTDGDLRRAIEKRADLYAGIVDDIMTSNPRTIEKDNLLVDVLQRLRDSHLNNYPVVDERMRIIGVLTWQMIVRERIAL